MPTTYRFFDFILNYLLCTHIGLLFCVFIVGLWWRWVAVRRILGRIWWGVLRRVRKRVWSTLCRRILFRFRRSCWCRWSSRTSLNGGFTFLLRSFLLFVFTSCLLMFFFVMSFLLLFVSILDTDKWTTSTTKQPRPNKTYHGMSLININKQLWLTLLSIYDNLVPS